MKIKSNVLGALVVVFVFGGVYLSSALNLWNTESSKIPVTITTGEFAGEYNPDDIRGSYSFSDINNLFDIPIETLEKAFVLPEGADASNFKNKDLEDLYENLDVEIGNSSVKLFVALYKGLPYEITEDTYLPTQAVKILEERANLPKDKLDYLNNHSIEIKNTSMPINSDKEYESTEDNTVKGNTTFKELMNLGLTKDNIESLIGREISHTNITIKDFCLENEIDFSKTKYVLQNEVDKLNNQE